MRLYGTWLVVVMLVVQGGGAARILMAVPIGARSHENFFIPLAEHLAHRNHSVTYLSGYRASSERPNLRVVHVPGVEIYNNLQQHMFNTEVASATVSFTQDMRTTCIEVLGHEAVQNLRKERFDLVLLHVVLNECFLSFVYQLKVPFIYVNPNKAVGGYAAMSGSPAFPALAACFFLHLPYPLTFTGRLTSTLFDIAAVAAYEHFIIADQDAECRRRELCPKDMPSLLQLGRSGSLFITNSVRTMETPTLPYTPTVVHAGGIHCRPAQPLLQELQQWVAGAGEAGFIYFSLGSLVRASDMPEKYRQVLVQVFGSLRQRVLWKWDEDTMPGLPPNVRLSKWLPQQDILGHPQLRLFITHGGLFSTQEAVYHGVPVLGMPVSLDQHHNMELVQWEGWGRVLHWQDLAYNTVRSHIQQLMEDPSVLSEAQRRAAILRDQPVPPGDWAAYWVEYVLRHRGAPHLRSPASTLPWYRLYNVDVWAVVVAVTLVTLGLASWCTYRALLLLVRFCCCCRESRKTKTN